MKTKSIFYVENDDNDAFLMKHALKQCGVSNPLIVSCDGQEAMDRLGQIAENVGTRCEALPGVVLLDINLPRKNGHDVLRWIRSHPALNTLSVIVLSSSSHDRDINMAYQLGANAYLVKPTALDGLVEVVKAVRDFWLKQNCPPPPFFEDPLLKEAISLPPRP